MSASRLYKWQGQLDNKYPGNGVLFFNQDNLTAGYSFQERMLIGFYIYCNLLLGYKSQIEGDIFRRNQHSLIIEWQILSLFKAFLW